MASAAQIRGMLLEEALLYLLNVSGYRTIDQADVSNDSTLCNGPAGIEVFGRGVKHQIDAIADYLISPPFSYPQRLLVEAKCYNKKVGVEVVRNAVGVLKDVSEHWVTYNNNTLPKQRYHYQYALFSSLGYTADAERYAFAHDIYLIPLDRSPFIQPIIKIIQSISDSRSALQSQDIPQAKSGTLHGPSLGDLRRTIRRELQGEQMSDAPYLDFIIDDEGTYQFFRSFVDQCRRIGGAALAMLNHRFPIFLVPNPEISLLSIESETLVRIVWDREGWYLTEAPSERKLFSFDIPQELFNQYAERGLLSPVRALDLKQEYMSQIQAIVKVEGRVRMLTFRLDRDWLGNIREQQL